MARPPRTVTWCGTWGLYGLGHHVAADCCYPHVTFDIVPRGGRAVVREAERIANGSLEITGMLRAVQRMRARGRKRG